MSWIVQHLLRNKVLIHTVQDIESDEYNNLLTVESKIDELYEEGLLSDIDLSIINLLADGRPIKDVEGLIDKNRLAISRTFVQLCNRIAYFLGGYFTDEGFLDNMKESYKLSDAQIEELNVYIHGKFKHTLMRKN
jgi:hypothetical protein